ncbi:MAG: recombinase family protein, partial [Verrucomicrobiales bacterium]
MRRLAYSYTRFSSLAQAGGDSVRRQSAAALEWCKRNSVTLVEDFADLGVSAFRGKNAHEGALAVFMKLAEVGRVPRGSCRL